MFHFKSFCRTGLLISVFFVTVFIVSLNFNTIALLNINQFHTSKPDKSEAPSPKNLKAIQEELEQLKCRKLPDILIIGFEKCGTVTLRQFLGIHPKIFITDSRLNNAFFNADNNMTVGEFSESLPCTPEGQLRLEKLAVPGQPELVFDYIPNVKLIAVVKEPTERALSHFVHLVDRKLIPVNVTDFDKYARYVFSKNFTNFNETDSGMKIQFSLNALKHFSLFADRLKPWVNRFGLDRVLIIDGDKFAANPMEELHKAETFIGLEHSISEDDFYFNAEKRFYCIKNDFKSGCMIKGKGRPHPVMKNSTRKMLKEYFEPHNKLFYEMTGRKFSWDDY